MLAKRRDESHRAGCSKNTSTERVANAKEKRRAQPTARKQKQRYDQKVSVHTKASSGGEALRGKMRNEKMRTSTAARRSRVQEEAPAGPNSGVLGQPTIAESPLVPCPSIQIPRSRALHWPFSQIRTTCAEIADVPYGRTSFCRTAGALISPVRNSGLSHCSQSAYREMALLATSFTANRSTLPCFRPLSFRLVFHFVVGFKHRKLHTTLSALQTRSDWPRLTVTRGEIGRPLYIVQASRLKFDS